MSHRSVISILLIVLNMLISCPKPEEADEIAPIVGVTSPVTGATVEDSVLIEVDASDNESVVQVEFWIDSALVNTDIESPWEYLWDTGHYEDGNQHNILARAIDPEGNVGSSEVVMVTVLETIKDIDGNVYRIVTIGDQVWMAENLRVTHYRNGEAINSVTDYADWMNLSTEAYCYYDNSNNNAAIYGALYNWYVIDDSRGLAPEGWHIPSDAENQELIDYLGGREMAGDKLKEAGSEHWDTDYEGATNESGFTALPGGYRSGTSGSYLGILGHYAYFWSSTPDGNTILAYYYQLSYYKPSVSLGFQDKRSGLSIRCVKD